MLQPKYIRVVLPSNKNIHLTVPTQQPSTIRPSQLKLYCQDLLPGAANKVHNLPSISLTNSGLTSPTTSLTNRLCHEATSSTADLQVFTQGAISSNDSSTSKSNIIVTTPRTEKRKDFNSSKKRNLNFSKSS